MYKCKICEYETENRYGFAGHMSSHKKKGGIVEEVVISASEVVEATSKQIADALLERVVAILTKYDGLVVEVGELKGYKERVFELERELGEAKAELERVLKIHNSQVKERKLTDAETLKRLAKL